MFIQNQSTEIDEADLNAIHQTALDYMEGWYDCDTERVTKALHPEHVKRNIDNGQVSDLSMQTLLDLMQKGVGANFKGDRQIKVTVLDVFKDIAALKIESAEYHDYVHVGKVNGEWMIVNVLWGFKGA